MVTCAYMHLLATRPCAIMPSYYVATVSHALHACSLIIYIQPNNSCIMMNALYYLYSYSFIII